MTDSTSRSSYQQLEWSSDTSCVYRSLHAGRQSNELRINEVSRLVVAYRAYSVQFYRPTVPTIAGDYDQSARATGNLG